MDLPRGYISYNQINLYQTCPKKYYYTYVEERIAPFNEKIFLGVVFHSVLEHYFQERIAGRSPTLEQVRHAFLDKFAFLQEEKETIWQTSSDQIRRRGLAFTDYFVRHLAEDIHPMMVEKELETFIPEIGVTLKGIIDLVEEDFSLTDFKTTTSRWSSQRVERSFLQMVIYKYLFEHVFENATRQLKLKILYSTHSRNVRHQEIGLRSADADLEGMLRVIGFVIEQIGQGIFYKQPSYMCGFCDFRDICGQAT